MQRFILVRTLHSFIALWIISVIVFSLIRISGSPADALLPEEATADQIATLEEYWGVNDPLHVQYFEYIANMFKGNFGDSFKWRGRTTRELIAQRIPATLQLAGVALLISVVVAVPLGILSAVKKDTVPDFSGKIFALLGQSLPSFWLGILIILGLLIASQNIFGEPWLPPIEYVSPLDDFGTNISQLVWPALATGYRYSAVIARMTRSALLDVLREDYVRTAYAKGLTPRKIVSRHALRNAFLPVITIIGMEFSFFIGGLVVTEQVFNLNGLGRLMVDSVLYSDYTVIQALTMVIVAVFVLINFAIDILYARLDPRIRYT